MSICFEDDERVERIATFSEEEEAYLSLIGLHYQEVQIALMSQ
jgi:hypothetical protein